MEIDAGVLRRVFGKLQVGDGCWEWTGAKNWCGYGQTWIKPKVVYVHRVMYAWWNGVWPEGQVDHLCRNPGCGRPDHLEAVTIRENARRAHNILGRCRKGHDLSVDGVYVLPSSGIRRCRRCAMNRGYEWPRTE